MPRRVNTARRSAVMGLLLWCVASPCVAVADGDPTDPVDHALGAPDLDTTGTIVVKVDLDRGRTIEEVNAAHATTTVGALIASRGIYVVRPLDPSSWDERRVKEIAARIDKDRATVYAEPNVRADLSDNYRFHAWPSGVPYDAGSDEVVWRTQSAVEQMRLSEVHTTATGSGVVVAVLDSGVDSTHPSLSGSVLQGWDYVDDDDSPHEVADGVDGDGDGMADDAFGHGTFVAGVVVLVAPSATVLSVRVLDDEGRGNTFTIAEAIIDTVDSGADVINLSFGTNQKLKSKLLEDAIKYAHERGAVVIAAAGNDGTENRHYPAAYSHVVAVTALADEVDRMATFSNRGDWAKLAAPGEWIAGPAPGGTFVWWSGTSVAAPFVSGTVALLESAAPGEKPNELTRSMEHASRKLLAEHGKHPARAIDVIATLEELLGT